VQQTGLPERRYTNICANTVTDTNAVAGENSAEVSAFCIKIVIVRNGTIPCILVEFYEMLITTRLRDVTSHNNIIQ